jgi:DNA-binding CsgD family transcriptional regulator
MNIHISDLEKEADSITPRSKLYPFSGIQLTETEIRIMEQLTKCLPDKESAEALGMQFYTFKTHLKRINIKLKARNRTQAVLIYLQLRGRLIDLPENQ